MNNSSRRWQLALWIISQIFLWTQDINWTDIRRSKDVRDIFWTSHERSVFVLCPGSSQKLLVMVYFVNHVNWHILMKARERFANLFTNILSNTSKCQRNDKFTQLPVIVIEHIAHLIVKTRKNKQVILWILICCCKFPIFTYPRITLIDQMSKVKKFFKHKQHWVSVVIPHSADAWILISMHIYVCIYLLCIYLLKVFKNII